MAQMRNGMTLGRKVNIESAIKNFKETVKNGDYDCSIRRLNLKKNFQTIEMSVGNYKGILFVSKEYYSIENISDEKNMLTYGVEEVLTQLGKNGISFDASALCLADEVETNLEIMHDQLDALSMEERFNGKIRISNKLIDDRMFVSITEKSKRQYDATESLEGEFILSVFETKDSRRRRVMVANPILVNTNAKDLDELAYIIGALDIGDAYKKLSYNEEEYSNTFISIDIERGLMSPLQRLLLSNVTDIYCDDNNLDTILYPDYNERLSGYIPDQDGDLDLQELNIIHAKAKGVEADFESQSHLDFLDAVEEISSATMVKGLVERHIFTKDFVKFGRNILLEDFESSFKNDRTFRKKRGNAYNTLDLD